MASIFGHIAASTAIGYTFFPKQVTATTLIIAGCCAFIPDLDVLAFRFGISYSSQWGHRGWTHSIFFAVLFGCLATAMYHGVSRKKIALIPISIWWIVSTLSHPLLDMLTNGGRGCALWWPWSQDRLFFPERPILVSPLGMEAFFSSWGLQVLLSEACWIGLPAILLVLLARVARKKSIG
jgi:inner membrane protein